VGIALRQCNHVTPSEPMLSAVVAKISAIFVTISQKRESLNAEKSAEYCR
jgi:hypothetical protein